MILYYYKHWIFSGSRINKLTTIGTAIG